MLTGFVNEFVTSWLFTHLFICFFITYLCISLLGQCLVKFIEKSESLRSTKRQKRYWDLVIEVYLSGNCWIIALIIKSSLCNYCFKIWPCESFIMLRYLWAFLYYELTLKSCQFTLNFKVINQTSKSCSKFSEILGLFYEARFLHILACFWKLLHVKWLI